MNKTNGGISFWGALVIALIVLKLCNVIQWSWWLILIPIWLPVAIVLGLGMLSLILLLAIILFFDD